MCHHTSGATFPDVRPPAGLQRRKRHHGAGPAELGREAQVGMRPRSPAETQLSLEQGVV